MTADTGTPEWAFRYDGFGRRVYRQNHITTPTSRRYYIYAGDTIIGEIDDGVPTVAYTVGPDGVASRRLLTGTPSSRFYCYGPQGETRNLTDEFQTVTSTYFYEAYGKPLGTAPSEYNPFRYGGKFGYYTDNEIQTLQVGARWYSPNLIRWMSRDPIHYRGGDNLSAYVMGNPVKFVDPSGLQSLPSNVREMFEPYFPRKVLEEAYFRRGMPWFGPSEDDARGFAPNWNVYIDKATYDRLFHKNGPQRSESDYELIAHELTHVEQYWANPIFKLDYAFKHLRYGYRRNPMEKEANEKARNIIESLKEGKHDLRP